MAQQYFCKNQQRLNGVREHPSLNGIEYLEVLDADADSIGSPRQRTLLVSCVKPLDATLSGDNVIIRGGVRTTSINVEWAIRAIDIDVLEVGRRITVYEYDYFSAQDNEDRLLIVRIDKEGDYSTYTLSFVSNGSTLSGFDVELAKIDFSFKVECPTGFDCLPRKICPPELMPAPLIDYLAKDYASFRQLMLDRLAITMPAWKEKNEADIGIAILEVLAYAADYLSYYQDAVSTEAYLGTARRRASIRRHARLLDYRVHEGCNARAWISFQVEEGVRNTVLKRKYDGGKTTRLLTKLATDKTNISEDDFDRIVFEDKPEVFELIQDLRLFDAHNDMDFYTWGDEQCCLPKGATKATLLDDENNRLCLCPGDVLIFEEVKGPETGQEADADPNIRHAVRLTVVEPSTKVDETGHRSPGPLKKDELFDIPIVKIEWSIDDALPFPLCISTIVDQNGLELPFNKVSKARGNVALADHGRTIKGESLPDPTGAQDYRPELKETGIIYHSPSLVKNLTNTKDIESSLPATKVFAQDPRSAIPSVSLLSTEGEDWNPALDLLGSDRFDSHFVAEVDNDGISHLRFGDNTFGKTPEEGVGLEANYRIGKALAGNVGADTIAHIVTATGIGIKKVRNPLPATGGTQPEELEEVRQYAPFAFRRQERAVTEADYEMVAERHPEVARAVARRRWTGSWHTIFITVDRIAGKKVDRSFEDDLRHFIEQYKLAGHDVEIEPPKIVPLDIAFTVCVEQDYLQSDVKQVLLEVFSNRDLQDGRRGFFHPDNFTFGQPVYLSKIVATAMEVTGVRWVEVDDKATPPARFKRWWEQAGTEIQDGYFKIGRLEVAQLENDPNEPENGRIEFYMKGGL